MRTIYNTNRNIDNADNARYNDLVAALMGLHWQYGAGEIQKIILEDFVPCRVERLVLKGKLTAQRQYGDPDSYMFTVYKMDNGRLQVHLHGHKRVIDPIQQPVKEKV